MWTAQHNAHIWCYGISINDDDDDDNLIWVPGALACWLGMCTV